MDDVRKFKFYMTDELGEEFSFSETVGYYDDEPEIEFILNQFKSFLLAVGYLPDTVSRLQYLEDDEWKHVLTSYGEWDSEKERIYQALKGVRLEE